MPQLKREGLKVGKRDICVCLSGHHVGIRITVCLQLAIFVLSVPMLPSFTVSKYTSTCTGS